MGGQAGTDEIELTPEMIEAGVSVLWELEGEVSKEALAREVFLAMAKAAALCEVYWINVYAGLGGGIDLGMHRTDRNCALSVTNDGRSPIYRLKVTPKPGDQTVANEHNA